MKVFKKNLLLWMFMTILIEGICLGQNTPADITATLLSEKVLHLKINQDLNIVAVNTKEGIVVIDTGYPLSITRKIKQVIEKEFGKTDFAYLINSHGHLDHSYGNQVFKNAEIIGHINCPEAMKVGFDYFNRGEEDFEFTPPSNTFTDRKTMNLGDISIEMRYLGSAHSGSDIIIHIPQEKLLLVGDAFDYYYLPKIKAEMEPDVKKWISVLSYFLVERGNVETVIPGHRKILEKNLLKAYLNYFKDLWYGIEQALSMHHTLDKTKQILMKNLPLDSFKHLKHKGGLYWDENFNSIEDVFLSNMEEIWKLQKGKSRKK